MATPLRNAEDALPSDEVRVCFSIPDNKKLISLHEHLRGPGPLIVIGGHGEAVSARAHEGQ